MKKKKSSKNHREPVRLMVREGRFSPKQEGVLMERTTPLMTDMLQKQSQLECAVRTKSINLLIRSPQKKVATIEVLDENPKADDAAIGILL